MRPTRQFWATAAVAGLLAIAAVAFARPRLLLGAAGVGAWLLAYQVLFVGRLARIDRELVVEQSVTPARVATDEDVQVTLTARLPEPSTLPLDVEADPPVATRTSTAAERTLRLDAGETAATTTFAVQAPVAGTHTFGEPTVRVADGRGFFTETFSHGDTASVAVTPRAPRNVHVGQGGEQFAVTYGEHEAGRLGAGLEPAELREYVAGDAANRIDWKATARLNDAYVREFEAETDRRTALFVDHRAAMNRGPEGETKLDYAREIALAILDSARELGDPLGLYTVGDEGVTGWSAPDATAEQYAALRHRLLDLEATAPATGADTPERPVGAGATGAGRRADRDGRQRGRSPAAARRAAERLATDDSAFGRRLRPYFGAATTYVQRIENDPLFGTVRTYLTRLRGTVWTVLLTDDTNRTEVTETVRVARRGDDHVLVVLTPSVLFEPGGLGDLEAAYDRYRDFEAFRRRLDGLARVTALELGPGDRLAALLDARRDRVARRRGGV